MVTISKGKVVNVNLLIVTLIILLVGTIFHGTEASAEMKKVTGTFEIVKDLETIETDLNNTKVRLRKKLLLFSSSHPDWDKARVFETYFIINPTRDGDKYRGSFAISHQNGDLTFVSYSGSWKWKMPKDRVSWTAETEGFFIGGTGKFEGIAGAIKIEEEGRGTVRVSANWEAEYDLK
jgi:hypothetical protein